MRNVQDCIAEAIKHSRGAMDSLQAHKDARFIREALAAGGWKIVRWDTGTEAPPLGLPHDAWSATPGADTASVAHAILRKMAEFPDDWTIDKDAKTACLERNHFDVTDAEMAYLLRLAPSHDWESR